MSVKRKDALLKGMDKIIHVLSECGLLKEGLGMDREVERLDRK